MRGSSAFLKGLVLSVFGALAVTVAACSNSGSSSTTPLPLPSPTPTPTTAPTAVPAAVATSIAIATVASGATAAPMTVAAPTGYTETVQLPVTAAAANTTVQVTNSVGAPPATSKIPTLSAARMPLSTTRKAQDVYNAIFYTIAIPSTNVTLSGAASQTLVFPSGGLSATSSYYLAFYDTTVANPAWNTIAGPVTPNGNTLTFSGTIPTYTLTGGSFYGLAVFSIAQAGATPPPAPMINTSPSPSPSPSPVPSMSPSPSPSPSPSGSASPSPFPTAAMGVTTGFGAGGSYGLEVFTATGPLGTINYPDTVDDVALDDAGNMYIGSNSSIPSPGASPVALSAPIVTKYAFDSTTPLATYTVSGTDLFEVTASGAGRLAVASVNNTNEYVDVWEPGVKGSPSFTLTIPLGGTCNGFTVVFLSHSGTLVVPMKTTNGSEQYAFYTTPSSSTPSSTITESVVPQGNQCYFSPNYVILGGDGTLYVTEYTFFPDDTLAGLYVYPPSGSEYFVATPSDSTNIAQPGSAPQAVDTDANGNVYVTNDNSAYGTGAALTPDTLHSLTIYAPSMGVLSPTPVRTISSGISAPLAMIVDNSSSGNGTVFIGDYPAGNGNTLEPNGAIHVVPAGSSTVTTIGTFTTPINIALYNGTTSRNILTAGSHGSMAGTAHGMGAIRARFAQRFRR